MAAMSSPSSRGRETRNRLSRCWGVELDWSKYPSVLGEVSVRAYTERKMNRMEENKMSN